MEPKLCRVCLNKSALLSIFDKQDDNVQYSAKIMRCVNIVVAEGDGLPEAICMNCVYELCSAYEFVNKCEASDKALRCELPNITKTEAPLKNEYNTPLETIKVENIKSEYVWENSQNIGDYDDFVLEDPCELRQIKSKKRKYTKSQKFTDNLRKRKLRQKSGPMACEVCGRMAASRSALENHARTHTGEKPFACETCHVRFNLKGTLKRHILTYHTEERVKKFVCETCGKRFFTKNAIKTHMRVHTDEKPYSCTCCGAAFRQIGSYIRHKRIHTGEKPFQCPVCLKRFSDQGHMMRHQLVHSDVKNFTCHLCNKSLKTKRSLQLHVSNHSNERRMICNYCGVAFLYKGNLVNHIRRRHSDKSGVCNICNKTFPNLESHSWKHTGEKPFVCKLCDHGFQTQRSLSWHFKFKHQNSAKFKCSVGECPKAFPTAAMLEFHLLKHHTNHTPFICHHCSRGFFRTSDLTKHLKVCHKDAPIKNLVTGVK